MINYYLRIFNKIKNFVNKNFYLMEIIKCKFIKLNNNKIS